MNLRTLITMMLISNCLCLVIPLVVLRLAHVILWSWMWVFAPLWLPIAVVGAAVGALAALERFRWPE